MKEFDEMCGIDRYSVDASNQMVNIPLDMVKGRKELQKQRVFKYRVNKIKLEME